MVAHKCVSQSQLTYFFKTLMSKYAPHLNSQFRPIRCRKCWAPSLALGGDGAVITAIYILRNSRNLVPKSQPLIASICSARARLGFGSGKRHKAINWQCHALCLRNERMSEGVGYFWGCFIASFSPNRILEFMAVIQNVFLTCYN